MPSLGFSPQYSVVQNIPLRMLTMSQLTLFNCRTPFMKNTKAKVASQASSSSREAETAITAGVSADASTSHMQDHVQVSENTVVDLTNDIFDTPGKSNSTVINAMVFNASPTPLRSSTPDFISSSDEEGIPITAEFSSDDDEVTASASLNHSDFILVDHTEMLPAFAAPTHSSGT